LSRITSGRGVSGAAVVASKSAGGGAQSLARIGRPPKGKTLLSLQRLLKEALAIVDEHGLDGLSMRALAERLGVTAMSLYRYCDSHEALLDAVHDEILGACPPRPVASDQSWREVTTEMARALRRAFAQHPKASMLLATRPARGPRSAPYVDAVLGRLVATGIDLAIAANLVDAISAFTIGHCLSAFGQSGAVTSLSEPQRDALLLPASAEPALPYLSQVKVAKSTQQFESDFVVGLVAILDGFANRYAKRLR